MSARGKPKLKDLEARLGHEFADRSLIERALTHSSARAERGLAYDNERLEFLGDRVLGLAIAELLVERFPEDSEGELARRFNKLVRRETCSEVAHELALGSFLMLGEGESDSGGRTKTTILSDACEALLGAMFLDAGFPEARRLVRKLWEHRLVTQADRLDAKTALQEWAQGLGRSLPTYAELSREGPAHAPRFTSEVRIGGLDPARGLGRSKREAEQAAAECFLLREGIWMRPDG